jgi:hypothetical protein
MDGPREVIAERMARGSFLLLLPHGDPENPALDPRHRLLGRRRDVARQRPHGRPLQTAMNLQWRLARRVPDKTARIPKPARFKVPDLARSPHLQDEDDHDNCHVLIGLRASVHTIRYY